MTILTPSAQKRNASAQSAQSVSDSISSHIGADAQEIFEAEVVEGAKAIFQYLSAIKEKKSITQENLKLFALAARDLECKGRLNTSALPMSKDQKLRLELLLYHYEENLLIQVTRRSEIEREYKFTAKKFDQVYSIFREGLDPGINRDEKLRLEIKALMAETDPIKRSDKKHEIATHFGRSYRAIDDMVAGIRQQTQQKKSEAFEIDDFLSQDSQEIEWLVPGFLPKGQTALLAALPKVGKTLLAVDLAFCLATGESSFLGESIKPAKVLLISVDESARSTRAKILKRGFRKGDKNIKIMTMWDISQMAELESVLEDFRPDLTIIDSLKRITLGKEISENSAEFADQIYLLKETLERYGSAGLLIHHANKNIEQSGITSVRGSTSITGACWGVWQLGFPLDKKGNYDPGDLNRILRVSARDSEGKVLNLKLELENNSFTQILTEADKEKRSQMDQVLDVLSSHPYGLNGKAIAHLTGIKSIYSVLNRLCERGQIESFPAPDDRRRLVYRLKAEFTPPSQSEEQEISQTDETHTQQEEKIDHKIDHKHLISENKPTTVACSPVENPTLPVKKTTPQKASLGFAKRSPQPDVRSQLIAEVRKCVKAKNISQDELDALIARVYGDSAPIERLAKTSLEALLDEINRPSVERSIK